MELLGDDDDIAALNEIQCKYPSDVDACCTKMFQLWLGKRQMVSWSHLIESMRHPNVRLHELARKIELMVLHSGNLITVHTQGYIACIICAMNYS